MSVLPLNVRWPRRSTAITLAVLAAVLLCWLPAFHALAERYVDAGLQRSLLSFATARALHSAVSVLQGTELAVQPMGVGLTLTLGQALAPINDLIAQFADWMLWASIAFGMQKLLLTMGGSYAVSAGVSLVALVWLVLYLRQRVPTWLGRVLVVLLFTRLVMPVTIIGSEWLFQQFLAQTYQQNQLATEGTVGQLQQLDASGNKTAPADAPAAGPDAEAAPDLWSRFKQWGQQAQQAVSNPGDALRQKLGELQRELDQQVERLISLIVVFVLQTIVIPLALVWALLQLCKGLAAPARRAPTVAA